MKPAKYASTLSAIALATAGLGGCGQSQKSAAKAPNSAPASVDQRAKECIESADMLDLGGKNGFVTDLFIGPDASWTYLTTDDYTHVNLTRTVLYTDASGASHRIDVDPALSAFDGVTSRNAVAKDNERFVIALEKACAPYAAGKLSGTDAIARIAALKVGRGEEKFGMPLRNGAAATVPQPVVLKR